MKRLLFTLLALFALLPLRSFADEALDGFKKEIVAIKTFSDDMDKKSAANPLIVFSAFGEMAAKIKAVATDGLPDDVKEPWAGFVAAVDKIAVVMAGFPTDPAELAKVTNDNAAMEAFGKKMEALTGEMKPHLDKLKAAGTKYNIPELADLGPK